MAVESPQRSAEDLRDMTRQWLAEHLPAGWMEAIDAGDTAAYATRARWARLRGVVRRVRRGRVRDADLAGGVRGRALALAR